MGFSSRAAASCVLMGLLAASPCFALPMDGGFGAGSGAHPQGPAYLGIDFRDVSGAEVGTLHLKSQRGAEIIMVDHDGPAGKAGLREHDVVLQLNGNVVEGEEQLRRMLHEMQPGKTASLTICRGGQEQTVTAVMANRAEVEKKAWQQHWVVPSPSQDSTTESVFVAPPEQAPAPKSSLARSFMPGHLLPPYTPYTGATVDAMGAQLASYFGVKDGKGLLVHDVEGNSPAAASGLRAGDVIVRMNGNAVATEKDWTRALHESKGHPVSLTVVRERQEQVLTMVPDSKKRSAVEEPAEPWQLPMSLMLR